MAHSAFGTNSGVAKQIGPRLEQALSVLQRFLPLHSARRKQICPLTLTISGLATNILTSWMCLRRYPPLCSTYAGRRCEIPTHAELEKQLEILLANIS